LIRDQTLIRDKTLIHVGAYDPNSQRAFNALIDLKLYATCVKITN